MTFNIPKRHFVSDKESKVVSIKMPAKMAEALDKHAEALGWTKSVLIDLILDQFFASLKGRSKLPTHEYKYLDGERRVTSLRLDEAMYVELESWGERETLKPKPSTLVLLAIDVYLSQNKISK